MRSSRQVVTSSINFFTKCQQEERDVHSVQDLLVSIYLIKDKEKEDEPESERRDPSTNFDVFDVDCIIDED